MTVSEFALACANTSGLLIAATIPETLGGDAGWVGTGLLGGVLSWLLFWHLPAKDKQVTDIIDKNNALNEREALAHAESQKVIRTEFHASLKDLGDRYEKHLQRVVDHCKEESAIMQQTIRDLKGRSTTH